LHGEKEIQQKNKRVLAQSTVLLIELIGREPDSTRTESSYTCTAKKKFNKKRNSIEKFKMEHQ